MTWEVAQGRSKKHPGEEHPDVEKERKSFFPKVVNRERPISYRKKLLLGTSKKRGRKEKKFSRHCARAAGSRSLVGASVTLEKER